MGRLNPSLLPFFKKSFLGFINILNGVYQTNIVDFITLSSRYKRFNESLTPIQDLLASLSSIQACERIKWGTTSQGECNDYSRFYQKISQV